MPDSRNLAFSTPQGSVKVLERAGYGGGPNRGPLEDILQFRIVVDVESADGQELLGALQRALPRIDILRWPESSKPNRYNSFLRTSPFQIQRRMFPSTS